MAEEKILKEIEKLAQMTARGFEEVATKKDLERFSTKEDLNRLEQKVDALDLRLSAYVSDTQERMEGLRRWVGELDQKIKNIEIGHGK